MNKSILIYGAGYVGMANGLALSKNNNVTIFDINKRLIENLKKGILHIDDKESEKVLKSSGVKFGTLRDVKENEFDFIIIALPTNFNEKTNKFETSIIEDVLEDLSSKNIKSVIVIKSTVPIGFTSKVSTVFYNLNINFSPEFLREGTSYSDAISPSRIIAGGASAGEITELLLEVAVNNPEVVCTGTSEAEAIKLFSNTYLAMRVAFVNELSTFSKMNNLDQDALIKGVSLDKRIGSHYFTPSMGYGGYCLPKDSKQLKYEFIEKNVPSDLFDAIVKSNETRKDFIVNQIIKSGVKIYEINGISHKPGVTNFRNSPKLEIAHKLREKGIEVKIFDENFRGEVIDGFEIK